MSEQYLHQRYLEAAKIRRMAEAVARKLGKKTAPDFLNPEYENTYKDGVIFIKDYESWLEIRVNLPLAGAKVWRQVFQVGGLTARMSADSFVWLDHLKGLYTASQFLTPARETGDQYIKGVQLWNRQN